MVNADLDKEKATRKDLDKRAEQKTKSKKNEMKRQ